MKGFNVILVLAVVLCLGAVAASSVAYGQTFMVDESEAMTFAYSLECQDNELNGMPEAPAYAAETASGQSIIFENGVPTTVIGADGTSSPYSASMWDFLSGYYTGGYGVCVSSNPDSPIGGTWKQVTESGTFGTQEPNLNLN